MTRIPSGSGRRASSAQRLSRITGGSSETTTGRPPRSPAAQMRPSSRSPRVAGRGDGASLPTAASRCRPRPAGSLSHSAPPSTAGQADCLERHGPREIGERPARRDELAQLVLGEERVRLALGVVERSSALALQGLDASQQGGLIRHAPPSAQRSSRHETAPGRDSRPSARPVASRGHDGRSGPAWPASRRDPRGPPRRTPSSGALPARSAAPNAAAAGASVSRIVLSPGWHRPRLARPLAAASSIAAMVSRSRTAASPARNPASMQAVP